MISKMSFFSSNRVNYVHVNFVCVKGGTELLLQIIFMYAIKISENTFSILN